MNPRLTAELWWGKRGDRRALGITRPVHVQSSLSDDGLVYLRAQHQCHLSERYRGLHVWVVVRDDDVPARYGIAGSTFDVRHASYSKARLEPGRYGERAEAHHRLLEDAGFLLCNIHYHLMLPRPRYEELLADRSQNAIDDDR